MINLHGVPLKLISNKTRSISAVWSDMCELIQMKRCMSTAYHSQSGGQTECMHRVLEDILQHCVSPTQQDWDLLVPLVKFAIVIADQEATQSALFMLKYGLHPHTPARISMQSNVPREQAQAQAKSETSVAECFIAAMQ